MPRRILFAVSSAAALAFSAAVLAAATAASVLPAGWSHAEVNVTGKNGRAHTRIYDRGRVLSVGPLSLTLKERDGQIVTIQVAPNAVIRINGRLGTLSQIAPRDQAQTLGLDGRPATQVLATKAPPKPPKQLKRAAKARSSFVTP
jgi:hypothetical protein